MSRFVGYNFMWCFEAKNALGGSALTRARDEPLKLFSPSTPARRSWPVFLQSQRKQASCNFQVRSTKFVTNSSALTQSDALLQTQKLTCEPCPTHWPISKPAFKRVRPDMTYIYADVLALKNLPFSPQNLRGYREYLYFFIIMTD